MGGRAGGGAGKGMGGAAKSDPWNGVAQRISGKVHLQGIGKTDAVKATDLKVGDKIAWNWGYSNTVTAINRVTAKFVDLQLDGQGSRLVGKNRYIGVFHAGNSWQMQKH